MIQLSYYPTIPTPTPLTSITNNTMVLKNIHQGPVRDPFSKDLTAGLPPDHARTAFRRLPILETDINEVSQTLFWNNLEGNQYLLVKDLGTDTRYKLAEREDYCGRRILFKGDTALIRVGCYNALRVNKFVGLIVDKCASGLGVQEDEMDWASGAGRHIPDTMDYYRDGWRNHWKYWRKREMVVLDPCTNRRGRG